MFLTFWNADWLPLSDLLNHPVFIKEYTAFLQKAMSAWHNWETVLLDGTSSVGSQCSAVLGVV